MFDSMKALYADFAKALGLDSVPAADDGSLQLMVGEASSVSIFAEDAATLLLASPVMTLPAAVDYGRTLWLLRRNYYDSPISPFRIGCDPDGSVVVWGRVPVAGLTGEELARLVDVLGAEADAIREEAGVEEG